MDPHLQSEIEKETRLRRTFAIISHPDAGKTTLTEKLLLYSGMIRTAGMVRARKGGKATSSDWMGLEQERGISISASAMQFRYKEAVINVLDTPGHQDFSEDTYRTLTAADSAVMVLDAAKGVEAQTRKLFTVCRMRGIPTLSFINKMDLPSKEPLDLLHEIEDVLGIHAVPLDWPVGFAREFIGVADCRTKILTMFERADSGGKSVFRRMSIEEAAKSGVVSREVLRRLQDDLELLSVAGAPYSQEEFLAGQMTPVFFGSALTNFGVEPFFDRFVELAPSPRPMPVINSDGSARIIIPAEEPFSAFVFKLQANIDPKHRDCMAFLRVCSGRFERDMTIRHERTGEEIRLARSYSMVARDRSTVEYAFPGDIVGVNNPGAFAIGDTLALDPGFRFRPMPKFAPELVAKVRPANVMKLKAFEKGLSQLADEGTVQILYPYENGFASSYVAAVGQLQFDVLQYRLKDEYKVDSVIEPLAVKHCAFLIGDPEAFRKTQNCLLARDKEGRVLVLFSGEWERRYLLEQNPGHQFEDFLA